MITGLTIVIVIGLGIGIWLGLQYVWNEVSVKDGPSQDKGYYAGAATSIYDNGKFSFTSSKNWKLSEQTSTIPTKYVFTSESGPITEYMMTVYLTTIPDIPTKYILPVSVQGNKLSAGTLSPKCDVKKNSQTTTAPTSATVAPTSFEGIDFTCKLEGFENIVALAQAENGYAIPMRTAKGEELKIGLLFQDLTASLHSDVIKEITNSFAVK